MPARPLDRLAALAAIGAIDLAAGSQLLERSAGYELLILAAALLVPQYVLVPWPRRWRIALGIAAPLLALGLSFEAGAGI